MEYNKKIASSNRIDFMDNIRFLMVLLVVVLHMACAYNTFTTWWVVYDRGAIPFNITLLILDIFLMPTLFFISGYFALHSIRNKSSINFIKGKFYRLGIPWVIGAFTMGTITAYTYLYAKGYEADFWTLFIRMTQRTFDFYTGIIDNSVNFNQYHLWFISLLLLFCVVFTLGYQLKNKLLGCSESISQKSSSNTHILLFFALAAICSAILSIILYKNLVQHTGKEPWLMIASVIQFQPTRIATYIICFILGIYAFHKQWFIDGNTPLHPAVWSIISVLLILGLFVASKANAASGFYDITKISIYLSIRTLAIFSIILTLLSLAGRYWQSSSAINNSLAKNSYIIYLIHMPIVYAFQFVLLKWNIPLYLKFFMGCTGSILVSYLISEYTFRRYPKRSVAAIFGLFAIALIIL